MNKKTASLCAGIVGLALCGFLALQSYRAKIEPEKPHALALAPPADILEQAAADHLRQGLEALHDRSNPPAARIGTYRDELTAAEQLLLRSLRANPARARALASLAAVRWELRSPLSGQETAELLDMIATAARMADASPRTLIQLGEVLLKMGRGEEGTTYLARAVELDGGISRRAIDIMRDNNRPAADIAAAFPRRAEVLAALRLPFLEDDDLPTYLDVVEGALGDSRDILSRELLVAYGSACMRERAASRLLRSMMALQPISNDELEAARLHQISRAHLGLGDPQSAIEAIGQAIAIQPTAAYLNIQLGDASLLSDDPGEAVEAYRAALGILARESGNPRRRATLYRKIGQAEERRGDMDRAYDAYSMALEIDPEEAHASRRLREMRDAAGLAPP